MNNFVDYVHDILSPHGHIKIKAMFGGFGVYMDGVIIGIIADHQLYFKVDASSVKDYENFGSEPFTYKKEGKDYIMSYWRVPDEVIEDQEMMQRFMNTAYAISSQAKKKPSKLRK